MPDKINVPLLGPTPKGGVLAGGLAVVGVAGYLIYKHYTKPKDTGTMTGAYGAYGAAAYGAYTNLGYGYMPPVGGFGGGQYPFYGPGTSGYGYGAPAPTTNAQWGQLVEQSLGSSGTDAIASAIGKYLAGLPITQAQQTTILEAEAIAGPPPQAGLGGFPPKMHVTKTSPKQPPPHNGHGHRGTTTITIHQNETLEQAAHARGWSAAFLAEVEHMTGLNPNSRLHRGEKLTIPSGSVH